MESDYILLIIIKDNQFQASMSILEKLISILLEKLDIGKWTFSHPSFNRSPFTWPLHTSLLRNISFKSLP